MRPYTALTIITAVLFFCAAITDATGYSRKYHDQGWNILSGLALVAWIVVTIIEAGKR